jgi:predicted ATPase
MPWTFPRGAPPYATYLFKHALLRDAAYGSLLRRRRDELHARIAVVLEAAFADRVAAEPEVLAWHLTEAGLFEKAVPWWQRAAERATARSAYREAIAHLKRGIEILRRLPPSRARDEQELLLQAALLAPLGAHEGYASAALELNRLEGELFLASQEPDEMRAVASFRKAIAIARRQLAKSWELRAATSLARLVARQGEPAEAHALLAPVYGWFTEGFDTADLIAAKALLQQLAS